MNKCDIFARARISRRVLAWAQLITVLFFSATVASVAVANPSQYVCPDPNNPGAATCCPLANPACTRGCAINWTDPVLTAKKSKVRAVHIEQLRACMNWAQALANVPLTSWADEPIKTSPPYTKIQAGHITAMEQTLNALCAHNGSATTVSTASTKGPTAAIISTLRSGVAACAAPAGCPDGTYCPSQVQAGADCSAGNAMECPNLAVCNVNTAGMSPMQGQGNGLQWSCSLVTGGWDCGVC
jgi:hypothetical protein